MRNVSPGPVAAVTLTTFYYPRIEFMKKRTITTAISCVLVLVSLFSLAFNGLRLGLDFSAGISIQLQSEQAVSPATVNAVLQANGFDNAQVVNFGSDRSIRIVLQSTSATEADQAIQAVSLGEELTQLLNASGGPTLTLVASDFVSPKAGADMAEKGGLGLLVALLMILIYISIRFQFKFAVGAVTALLHDVVITLGFFSLFQLDFDLQVLAGLLAVIGYSLNDTIIVSDRIRENFRRMRRGSPEELINLSVNQTLSRTLVTTGTTLMVVLVMLFAGGESIRGFSLALLIGIGVGTYSSIYIASAILLYMALTRDDLQKPVVEGATLDQRP